MYKHQNAKPIDPTWKYRSIKCLMNLVRDKIDKKFSLLKVIRIRLQENEIGENVNKIFSLQSNSSLIKRK